MTSQKEKRVLIRYDFLFSVASFSACHLLNWDDCLQICPVSSLSVRLPVMSRQVMCLPRDYYGSNYHLYQILSKYVLCLTEYSGVYPCKSDNHAVWLVQIVSLENIFSSMHFSCASYEPIIGHALSYWVCLETTTRPIYPNGFISGFLDLTIAGTDLVGQFKSRSSKEVQSSAKNSSFLNVIVFVLWCCEFVCLCSRSRYHRYSDVEIGSSCVTFDLGWKRKQKIMLKADAHDECGTYAVSSAISGVVIGNMRRKC